MSAKPAYRLIGVGGGVLLLAVLVHGYYRPHFVPGTAIWLAFGFTFFVVGIIWMGYRSYREEVAFPVFRFTLATLMISFLRWAYAYSMLQRRLPETTVFHDPLRALWFIVPTSAVLLLLGYGLAQYRYLRARLAAPAEQETPILSFRSGGKEVRLPVADILHVQANGEYLLYRCADRQYARFQRLKEAATELAPFGFVRVHRSHLVARRAIRTVSPKEVELEDGTRVPVSRTYRGGLSEVHH